MKKRTVKRIVLSALFLSIGLVLPLLTNQIKEIGDTLLPMHLPVMLCGLICGAKYGGFVGLILPFVRALTFGMPPIYPNALWMAAELAAYGFVIGCIYARFKRKNTAAVCVSLIFSMIAGRIVWGLSKALLLGLGGKSFGISAFVAGGFVDALPGIIIQLVLVPLIMRTVNKKRTKK